MKKMKYVFRIIALFLLLYNSVQTYLSAGIISGLLGVSVTYIILAYSHLNKRSNHTERFSVVFLTASAVLILGLTLLYSPRYYYKQAQEIIISKEYKDNSSAYPIDLKWMNKKILVKDGINLFIDRGYVIGIQLDGSRVFYFFDPVTGEYSKFDPTEWDTSNWE